MDTDSALKTLSRRAARYSLNLDGQVDLDKPKGAFHGKSALVYPGILRQNGVERHVAVKVFRSGPPGDLDMLKRILQEVHLWSKLSHKNIVQMLGISTDFDSTISIISDWMEMGDAFTYVQNQKNDPRPLIVDIAAGLCYLHSHRLGPILHGDLKGPNILISNDGRALLADFGLSTLRTCTFSLTIEARSGGTIAWIAPEILDGKGISVGSDIWAFGMTALELFTRSRPFPEKPTEASIMYRILQGPPNRPHDELTCSRLTDVWWDVCLLCWKAEPLSRPGISEIVQKLNDIMVGDMSVETCQFPPPPVSPHDHEQPPVPSTSEVAHSKENSSRYSPDHPVHATPLKGPTAVHLSNQPRFRHRRSASHHITTGPLTPFKTRTSHHRVHSMSCLHTSRFATQGILEVNGHRCHPLPPSMIWMR